MSKLHTLNIRFQINVVLKYIDQSLIVTVSAISQPILVSKHQREVLLFPFMANLRV